MMELWVTRDKLDDIWNLVLEVKYSGGGQPAFYNEEMITKIVGNMFSEASEEDKIRFSGVGCTETMPMGVYVHFTDDQKYRAGYELDIELNLNIQQFLNGLDNDKDCAVS